jgi:putative ABC transport system ATP-binding protein
LLADEPTARLDQANALAVTNLLANLAADTGAAVVCATHDPIVSEQADDELRLAGAIPGEPVAPLTSVHGRPSRA